MGILSTVLKFVAGGGLSSITEQLRLAYKDKIDAANDSDRIEAEQRIAQLQARQAVLIEEIKSDRNWWIRPAFALPMIIYTWKVVVYDKVMGWGYTDDLSPDMWRLFWIVVGTYFLTRGAEYVVGKAKKR